MNPVRVLLAGGNGHGRWHLDNLRRLTDAGLVRLVGVCDLRPVPAEALAGLGKPAQSTELGGLIRRTGAEVTVLVTPIHTHEELAVTALRAGSHLLLEKPPAPSLASYERIVEAVRVNGRACQIGFQTFGSEAISFLRKVIADGTIGRLRGIGVAGAWDRPAGYFNRAAWAGRRRLDGVAVTDGVLTNPFAHAVATALAVAEAEQLGTVREMDIELYRANQIEADDTSCVRLSLADGTVITVAVSLCASRRHEPYLVAHGETGQARLHYTLDEVEVRVPGQAPMVSTHGRTDLLENLIGHIRTGAQLLAPLPRAGAFMQVVEAVRQSAEPRPIPAAQQRILRDSTGEITARVLPGIAETTARSADRLALYSELDVPWAPPEHRLCVGGREVARYRWRPDLPDTAAPRPYLHPVRTLSGVEVTEAGPADHVHHLGVGLAVADVAGTNFWGGRTFVAGHGPAWRADHGRQRHLGFAHRSDTGFVERIDWLAADGTALLAEERRVTARLLDRPGCWELDFSCTLTNRTGAPLLVKSSATKGRVGAGYGGFFWRAPGSAKPRAAFTADADGEAGINGRQLPWVGLHGPDWTMVFAQVGSADPWFVRVREYPGVGPSLAWDRPLVLEDSVIRRVITVVADGRLDRNTSAALARTATER